MSCPGGELPYEKVRMLNGKLELKPTKETT